MNNLYKCTQCLEEFRKPIPAKVYGMTVCDKCYDKYFKKIDSKQIPIKNLNINYENTPMETIEPIGKYRLIGESIGKLVDEKNQAYGDSFNKSAEFLKILFPSGVPVEAYSDMLGIIRIFDKLMRIATNKDALGENPWKDICGYSILKSE